ncbi:hypothetical protein PR202_ga30878 [Eleusine coracana subsp. coracana]|uniref:Uncharacterized protein n=1 Tax=Eleusine coracana subsp. coracana TaxID=191504 RepID=A0AAV5DQH1_ELECO|nr:hypothetical protein PR202_ga30878 [Eleusine coracana subsp. coracana]
MRDGAATRPWRSVATPKSKTGRTRQDKEKREREGIYCPLQHLPEGDELQPTPEGNTCSAMVERRAQVKTIYVKNLPENDSEEKTDRIIPAASHSSEHSGLESRSMDMAQEKKGGGANIDRVVLVSGAGGVSSGLVFAADKLSGELHPNGRRPSPYAVQVVVDAKAGDPVPMAPAAAVMAGGTLSAVVGIVAASSVVTALAGGAVSPAVAFGFFLVLLGGRAGHGQCSYYYY